MRNPFRRNAKYSPPVQQTKVGADEEDETERGTWSHQCDFILTCVGYAVGLGNLWRFPYLCMRNGGGAFLIPYFTFLVLCGIPLFFLELSIGQFASLSPLSIWDISPLFRGLGWGAVLVSTICAMYYNIIITWVLFYLGHSFSRVLPWSHCDNAWNTKYCTLRNGSDHDITNGTLLLSNTTANLTDHFQDLHDAFYGRSQNINITTENATSTVLTGLADKLRTPSEEFWQFKVLELSPGIDQPNGIRWELVICLIVAWLTIFACLCKGVKSIGKVVYVTATLPYLFLTVLLIRGLMLPGAIDGIKFYIIPDFNKLKHFQVWAEGCLQIFYSLGPAWGGLITMASYNKFQHNCLRDAILVPMINCGTSFFAGFVIFSAIGFMAKESNLSVETVITSGPGLAFIAYPEALTKLPFAPIWAVSFFLMLLTIGLDSQFGMVETLISGCVDMYPKYLRKRKTIVTAGVCSVGFLFTLPYVTRGGLYVFQIVDWYCAAFSVMVIALFECIVLSYVYGWRRLYYDIEMMIGRRPGYWWAVCWCGITPGIMLVVIVFSCFQMGEPTYGNYRYPRWAIGMGWMTAMVSLVPIPGFMLLKVLQGEGSLWQRIKMTSKPADSWGPDSPEHRAMYKYAQCNEKEMCSLPTTSPA